MTRTTQSAKAEQDELDLLAAARAGDEQAFGRLASQHREELHLYCRLMLGCPRDADRAVCETLLRGWRGLPGASAPASARIWLYRLATDVCLEGIERRERLQHH